MSQHRVYESYVTQHHKTGVLPNGIQYSQPINVSFVVQWDLYCLEAKPTGPALYGMPYGWEFCFGEYNAFAGAGYLGS